MTISVVIPAHNAAPWLGAALDSVAAQSAPPHQVIVVDDSSDDDSAAIAGAHPVVTRLLNVRCRNAAAARNAGIAVATGDWIALLDADDRWLPVHLEQARERLGGSPEVVAYQANHHWLIDDREVCLPDGQDHDLSDSPAEGLPASFFVERLLRGFHFGHSTVLYRRSRLETTGAFDPAFVRRHDIELWLRTLAGARWAYGARPAALYRQDTPGSISKQAWSCQLHALRALLLHRQAHDSPTYRALLRREARRALSLALTDAGPAEWRETTPPAGAAFRLPRPVGLIAGRLRPLFLAGLRLKRRLRPPAA